MGYDRGGPHNGSRGVGVAGEWEGYEGRAGGRGVSFFVLNSIFQLLFAPGFCRPIFARSYSTLLCLVSAPACGRPLELISSVVVP